MSEANVRRKGAKAKKHDSIKKIGKKEYNLKFDLDAVEAIDDFIMENHRHAESFQGYLFNTLDMKSFKKTGSDGTEVDMIKVAMPIKFMREILYQGLVANHEDITLKTINGWIERGEISPGDIFSWIMEAATKTKILGMYSDKPKGDDEANPNTSEGTNSDK